jgi:hypothetical protein
MKSEFLVVAQNSAIDHPSNQLSIFNIIDEVDIGAQNLEAISGGVPLNVQVICSLVRDDSDKKGEFESTIKLVSKNPDGKVTRTDQIPVKFEAHHVRNRVRIGATILLTGGGIYVIDLLSEKGVVFASKALKVNVRVTPQP